MKTSYKLFFFIIRTVHMNCFVYSLTDPHATGLRGDLLLDIGITGHRPLANHLAMYSSTYEQDKYTPEKNPNN